MSEREWKPGDVATVRNVVAIRDKRGSWHGVDSHGEWYTDRLWDDRDGLRPLVVIDPQDADTLGRLARQIDGDRRNGHVTDSTLSSSLDAFLAPPKPEEPGRYGVVVAGDGREWFRWTTSEAKGRDWCRASTGDSEATAFLRWADLDVIRVVRDGVTP